jgi:hypothetical protein
LILYAGEGEGRPLRVHAELIASLGELNNVCQVVLEVTEAGRWKTPSGITAKSRTGS